MAAASAAEMQAGVQHDENRAEQAQLIFEVAGFPTPDCPSWDELVEVRHGAHGRETVAREAIAQFTFVRTPKVRLGMTDAELDELHDRFSGFIRRAVPEVLGSSSIFSEYVQEEDLPHGSGMSAYVGVFLSRGLDKDPMVQDLMDFDMFGATHITNTLKRLMLGDVLRLHFWRETLAESVPADKVWAVFSFILSHAFLNDGNLLTFSPFCLSGCPPARWAWYMCGSDKAAPPVHAGAGVADLLGSFEEVSPWGRQTHVGDGQVAADECVVFIKAVDKGGAVEMDYGEEYMLPLYSRLQQFRGDEIETLIEAVLGHFDSRVLEAFQTYMACQTYVSQAA